MELINNPEQLCEYEEFVSHHQNGGFMQSLNWAKVKKTWKREIVVSRSSDGTIRGSMLVLVKKVPLFPYHLLYAPRGPVCNFSDRETMEDLLTGVKALAQKYRAYLFRMDPYIMADDQEFISMARDMGFSFTPHKPDFTTIQTRMNYMLDIGGKTPDELLMSFHSRWRYKIRVAQKHGVQCIKCDKSHLPDFYRIYKITGERDHFDCRPMKYFEEMMDAFPDDQIGLFLCYYEGHAISGAVTTRYAGKTCYVYGASDNAYRNVMPNYLMQWTMINWALEGGCYLYDFQGIPVDLTENSPMYGVYKFKKGFNGHVVEFAGEFDYIFSKTGLLTVNAGQKVVHILKMIKHKLTRSNAPVPHTESDS